MDPSHVSDVSISAAVVTVSSSRTPETDAGGSRASALFEGAGIAVTWYGVVPDAVPAIRHALVEASRAANCIVITGGTGLTPDDRTIEAVAPLLDRTIDGFGELFRAKSAAEIGTASILSRAVGGLFAGSAVFCIPGSEKAVRLGVEEIIIPEIRHILTHARGWARTE
ncbi:MAG: MogA/MoaB family molybdenum cofactor biosynthesis protein [Methanomicrobiales archaeon]